MAKGVTLTGPWRLSGAAVLTSFFMAGIALAQEAAAPAAAAETRLFAPERLNIMIPVVLFTLIILYYISQARQGKSLFIRNIPGLDAIEEALGRATEMGKPILYIPGIDDATNIQTIYSMIILNHVAKRVAQYDTPRPVNSTSPGISR